MTQFTDTVAGRVMDILVDSFVETADVFPNGDSSVQEDGSQSRSYRAVDTAVGVDTDYLPRWGVSDYTMCFGAERNANLNPSGFSGYWAMACSDNAYGNVPDRFRAWPATTSNIRLTWASDGAVIDVPLGLNEMRHFAVFIESSNLTGSGEVLLYVNGIRYASAVHSVLAAPTYGGTGHYWQRGGRSGASDFGVLALPYWAKLGIFHRRLTDEEIVVQSKYYLKP